MARRRAYTTTELFITLALMALVGVILYPLMSHSRAKALKASCLSNSKSMGLGFAMYATEYDKKLPIYDNHSKPGYIVDYYGEATASHGRVIPFDDRHPVDTMNAAGLAYIRNVQVLQCPSDPHKIRNLSYTWNELFAGFRQDEIVQPALKVMMVDQCSVTDFTFVRPKLNAAGEYEGAWSTMAEPENFVHLGGLNMLYCDGHAKWLDRGLWPLGGPITPGNKVSGYLIDSEP